MGNNLRSLDRLKLNLSKSTAGYQNLKSILSENRAHQGLRAINVLPADSKFCRFLENKIFLIESKNLKSIGFQILMNDQNLIIFNRF